MKNSEHEIFFQAAVFGEEIGSRALDFGSDLDKLGEGERSMPNFGATGRWGDCDMGLRGQYSSSPLGGDETPPLDLSGGENHAGMLSRLQTQNSALERLRLALDSEDDMRDTAHSPFMAEWAKADAQG